MTPEQRLDRVERVLGMMATSGRKARSEFRQNINILINMHIQNEEQRRAQSDALNEKINILIDTQRETTEQIKGLAVGQEKLNEGQTKLEHEMAELTKSQKLTDRALRAFIDSLRKGGNGNSST
ncbi:MAG TPA: hypothetical protein VK274_06945 [Pyrinomonadaceae bacterium]|nr:hypothetical protein [Pyrinomonadaceae bacterium]